MNLIDRVLDKCTHSGAEMAEVYYLSSKTLSITVRNGKVESIQKSTPGGLAIRYFSFGKTVFAHTTDTSDESLDSIVTRLSRLVRKTGKDEFTNLPGTQEYQDDLDIYSPDFISAPTDDKIQYLAELEQLALKYDPLIDKSNGASYTESISTTNIANTNGMQTEFDSTTYKVGLSVIATKKGEMFPGEGDFSARYFTDLPSREDIVDKIASKAVRLIGGTVIEGGDYEIIFTPEGAGSILWGLSFALNGDQYLKSSSFLAGKEGTKLAIDGFNLYDNPLMARGIASRPADAEGIASRKLILFENGIFKSPLYDSKTAARAGTNSTGSSSRSDYTSFPDISPSNFYIDRGKNKFEDVVASCRKGIIVENTQGWGLHSITGQYSAGINGTLVRNGKRIKPVADVTIAAGTSDIFDGIGAICDDLTFYRKYNSPSLMIKNMRVGA